MRTTEELAIVARRCQIVALENILKHAGGTQYQALWEVLEELREDLAERECEDDPEPEKPEGKA